MYKSVLCHLHSTFEGPASISGYCHEAAKAGVDVLWLSDHDSRIPGVNGIERRFTAYDFGRTDPFAPVVDSAGRPQDTYWQEMDSDSPDLWVVENGSDGSSLVLRTRSEGETFKGTSIRLLTRGKSHNRSLLSRPTISLELGGNIDSLSENARLIVTVHLSQTPPEHKPSYLRYVLGGAVAEDRTVPLEVREGRARLSLTDDAERLGLGLDHATRHIDIRLESRYGQLAEVRLKRLQLETGITDPDYLLQAQLELGQKIGRQYGVDVVVGYEISAGKEHRNCYGAAVPFFPYGEWQERPPQDALNSHVERYGGLTSINHAFSDLKRRELSDEERMAAVEERANELVSERGYGSRLIEIGFPEGRHGFDPFHYLLLWDQLNLAGLRICGIGVSDAHSNISWEKGNNFANYVASPDSRIENLVAGMKSGNFYMADPYRLRGQVRFSGDNGKTMGDTQSGGYVELALSDAPVDAELTWVLDGRPQSVEKAQGKCKSSFCIDGGQHFVRAELRNAEGRIILLTNPLWME